MRRSREDRNDLKQSHGRVETDVLFFLALLGVLVTVLGYRFGLGNQIEHLPIVMRLLDASYLTHDFYVESASKFGPRFYYAHILAALGRVMPLSVVLFGLALAVNLALASLSYFAARRLLGADKLAGFAAATLVLAVPSFSLGLVTDIRFIAFQPGSLAIPFALAAFWSGLEGRPILAGALASVASIPHPLYGVETGAIALATALAASSFTRDGGVTRWRFGAAFARVAAGGCLLGVSTFVLWGLPTIATTGERIPSSELISILAVFRSPHHYLPSQFPLRHYAGFAAFAFAVALAWRAWVRARGRCGPHELAFLAAPVVVGVACIGGYVFVELWPSRLWVTAQPFRMLYVIKWQGLLLLGWLFTRWIRDDDSPRRWLGWLALVGSSGAAHAPVACLCLLADHFGGRLRNAGAGWLAAAIPAGVGVGTAGLLLLSGSLAESAVVAVATLVAVLLLRAGERAFKYALPAVLVGAVVLGVGLLRSSAPPALDRLVPIFSFDDQRGDDFDAARWVEQHVDEDALFIVPPSFGSFRLVARRAVVVDWKAIPFEQPAMREWRDRMRFCYGPTTSAGFAAQGDMEQSYRGITDAKLDAIRDRYGVRFGLIHAETPTERQVLYANPGYRVVAL